MKYTKLPAGKYATATQYAKAHRVSRTAVSHWIHQGRIKAVRVGEIWLVRITKA